MTYTLMYYGLISTPQDTKGEEKPFNRFLESDLRSDFPRGVEEAFSTFRSDVLAPWLLALLRTAMACET